jgi:hypothetical protein
VRASRRNQAGSPSAPLRHRAGILRATPRPHLGTGVLAATRSGCRVTPFFSRQRRLPGTFGYATLPDGNLLQACGLRDSLGFALRHKVIRAGNLLIPHAASSRRLPGTC